MDTYTQGQWDAALAAVEKMTAISEKARAGLAPGSAQHSLVGNRLYALGIVARLMRAARKGVAPSALAPEDLRRAAAPVASLISKSEKARQRVPEGGWQRRMLDENIAALRIGAALLEAAMADG